jgi:membrane protein DedA with SNARE-associated domain
MLNIPELWNASTLWVQLALQGAASPWVIGVALVLTSFLLEDAAIAAAAALATHGDVTWLWAFSWVFAGIAVGDLGLYAAGLGARRIGWLQRKFITTTRQDTLKHRLESHLSTAVLVARVIPGLRLVTYTLCGFSRVSFLAFAFWVALAVALWTVALFTLGAVAGEALSNALHIPQSIAVALPIVLIAATIPVFKYLQRVRKEKPL